MAITKDKGSIRKFSGGELWARRCTDEGAVYSTGGAFFTLGYVQESKLSDVTENEPINDETGGQVASLEGSRKVMLTGLFMQTDKELLDFLTSRGSYTTTGARGNYFNIYHNDGTLNGKTQEYMLGICVIKPQLEVASGVKRPPFEITVLKNETALTSIPTTGITGVKAATITVPAGEYYAIAETTT